MKFNIMMSGVEVRACCLTLVISVATEPADSESPPSATFLTSALEE